MRNPALALAAAVFLSVGSLSTRAAAQTAEPSGAATGVGGAISRRVHVDFGARGASESSRPSLPSLGRTFAPRAPEGLDIPASIVPMDCRMPTLKADPNIDPKIVTPPPSGDRTTYFMRGIPAPLCAGPPR